MKHKIDLVWPKLAMVVFALCLLVYIHEHKHAPITTIVTCLWQVLNEHNNKTQWVALC